MKDRILLTNPGEIAYIAKLIENDVRVLEINLEQRQKFLSKFKDRGVKNAK